MVGVAGKSKGCNTCRKRKLKCDQAGIPCGPCQKSKRICTGYQRDRHFKNLSSLDHESLLSRTQPLVPNTESSVLRAEMAFGTSQVTSQTHTGKEEKTITFSLSHDQIFETFMKEYMPSKSTTSVQASEPQSPLSFMQLPPRFRTQHASLDNALAALSLVRLGRKYDDEKLREKGMGLYGQALEGMQEALMKGDSLSQDQILASCLTMAVFELLEVPGQNVHGWVSHIRGLSKLFQLRDPSRHASGPSHSLFLGFRPTEIIYALATRQSTYLSKPNWLILPWKNMLKSDFHHLLDLMTRLPTLLEQTESRIQAGKDGSLLERSWELERDLRTWYEELRSKSTASLFTIEPSIFDHTRQNSLSGIIFHGITFADFDIARMHLFYWAALLLTYNNIQSLSQINNPPSHISPELDLFLNRAPYSSGQFFSFNQPSQPLQTMQIKMVETAKLILSSTPYLVSGETHILGPQNVFFPLRIAQHTFSQLQGCEEELEGCKMVFKELTGRGFKFGELLSRTDWDSIPGLLAGRTSAH